MSNQMQSVVMCINEALSKDTGNDIQEIYLGKDPAAEGCWKLSGRSDNIYVMRLESGVWVEKGAFLKG